MRWHRLDFLSPHAGCHAPIFTSPSVIQRQMWLSRCWLRTSPALRLGSYLLTSALRAQQSPLSCAKAFQSKQTLDLNQLSPMFPPCALEAVFIWKMPLEVCWGSGWALVFSKLRRTLRDTLLM